MIFMYAVEVSSSTAYLQLLRSLLEDDSKLRGAVNVTLDTDVMVLTEFKTINR